MPFISQVSLKSIEYKKNFSEMSALNQKMRNLEKKAKEKSEKRRSRFQDRNQISPRERLSELLDDGLPFLELFNMANYLCDDKNPEISIPGASIISGIGFVNGIRCLIWVDDSGINAGSWTEKSVEKGLGLLKISLKQKLPLIHLVESGGLNLMSYTVELWANAGGLFSGLAKLSSAGIPSITILHGLSTAGGAYQPGLSDYVIGVRDNGMAALAGSALVKAATGEISSDQELGGIEMHSKTTGLIEFVAENDSHGIEIARKVVESLNWNERIELKNNSKSNEPNYRSEELLGIVPIDYKKPYDVREVVARVVNESDFTEFKPHYGSSTVCLFAKIGSYDCGIIGNNGPLDPNGATKAAHFFQLCDQADKPIIFLNNTTGFMVGKEFEHAGMIKHGSKMIQAVTNVNVPKLAFYIGASFGAGNYGMCGHSFGADFLFTWPNAVTGVMGGEQASTTMEQVLKNAALRRGQHLEEKNLAKQKKQIRDHFDFQSDAFYTSGRMLDQGMIDPRDTRKVIMFCLDTCLEARNRKLKTNTFGIARL